MKYQRPLIILAIIAGTILSIYLLRDQTTTNKPIELVPAQTTTAATVTQKINFGEIKPAETQTLDLLSNETVLSILQRTRTVTVKQYDFGALVDSIDGVVNGTDNKYWLFYINDKESATGAHEFQPVSGDVIEWRFKTYEE